MPDGSALYIIVDGVAIKNTGCSLYGTIFGTVVARSVATKQSSGLNSLK
ncbi:hypothetical protein [Legionella pneumophila]|nr:hypothetical protein [Legionella pneumophila]MDI9828572.1 hypothetical protein [Legionella pneumophila]MDW8996961.1 hypothetical protein [Legionella pneumophila]HAT7746541.1 hypothetical protein [Legionella pneumophila]HAT7758873.1 hypothetical protein [Legionella pneumophila]HBD7311260.1 hypothetical protein [Legionella pneumophila]